MGALKQTKNPPEDLLPNPGPEYLSSLGDPLYTSHGNQSWPTLIAMVIVLMIILLFCFWGAPAVRSFCKRKICCFCPMDEPSRRDQFCTPSPTTPTIILLPFGRMLVVDRRIFDQIQIDYNNSIDHHRYYDYEENSNSLIDSETSINLYPPSYEEIYGEKLLPPSYSEISLKTFKNAASLNDASATTNRLLWTSLLIINHHHHNHLHHRYDNQSEEIFKFVSSRNSRSMNDLNCVNFPLNKSNNNQNKKSVELFENLAGNVRSAIVSVVEVNEKETCL